MRKSRPARLEQLAAAAVAAALLVTTGLAGYFLATADTPPPNAPPSFATLPVTGSAATGGEQRPVEQRPVEQRPVEQPQPARVTGVIQRPDRFDYGAWLWDDAAPAAGSIVVTVDLRAQLLRVWRGGREVGVSTILYGAPDSPTPLGSFAITQKSAKHVSNIYGTPMPFAMRLTNDGVMVHGSNVRQGWASNGCVGIPTDFARRLFAEMKLGDRVVITDGKPLHGVGDPLPIV